MHCSEARTVKEGLYSGHGSLRGVEDFLIEVLEDACHSKTTRTNQCREFSTRNIYTGSEYSRSPSSETVVEIDAGIWTQVWNTPYRDLILSVYYPKCGKIFLRGDCNWCLCNLIHEILHSRSCLSKSPSARENLEFVTEGTTELLTGWILRGRFDDCYSTWQQLDSCCFLTNYERYVKAWFYLCTRVITISDLSSLYLDNSLRSPFLELIKLLRGAGLRGFKNVFRDLDSVDFEMFLDEVGKAVGEDFAVFQASPPSKLDLDMCVR